MTRSAGPKATAPRTGDPNRGAGPVHLLGCDSMSETNNPTTPATGADGAMTLRAAGLVTSVYSLPADEYRQFMRELGSRGGRDGYHVGQRAALDRWKSPERERIPKQCVELGTRIIVEMMSR